MGSFPKCIIIQDFQDYTFTNLCQSWSVNLMVCIINMLILFLLLLFLFFASLLLGISTCYSTREQFYLSGITSLFFYPLFFLSEPSTSPHSITSEKMNETTYRISWNPLPRNTSNGRVIAYEVKLSTSRTAKSVSTPSVLQNTSDTFIILTGLTSSSVYKVEVRAYTSAGPGVFGSMAHVILTSGI